MASQDSRKARGHLLGAWRERLGRSRPGRLMVMDTKWTAEEGALDVVVSGL